MKQLPFSVQKRFYGYYATFACCLNTYVHDKQDSFLKRRIKSIIIHVKHACNHRRGHCQYIV